MLVEAQRFSFTEVAKSLGAASSLPYLPLTLNYQDISLSVIKVVNRTNQLT